MSRRAVNILGTDNGGGFSRDIMLLNEILSEEGCTVFLNQSLYRKQRLSLRRRVTKRLHTSRLGKFAVSHFKFGAPFELNIHLEEVQYGYFWLAKRNILIPNQECFTESAIPYLTSRIEVWAKTKVAQQIFSRLGCPVRFLGWSGTHHDTAHKQSSKKTAALHIAGSSYLKGTESVLDVWEQNPHWPILRVLRRDHNYSGASLSWRERAPVTNIEIITHRLDEEALRRLRNESAFYLCPSEAEGFGHVIIEGMSSGAVIITTNAPPMNELVTPDTGLLAAVERSEPKALGERHFVSHKDLEHKISRALEMTASEREAIGRAARERYEKLDREFRLRLKERLREIFADL
jgi:hypothetical protein